MDKKNCRTRLSSDYSKKNGKDKIITAYIERMRVELDGKETKQTPLKEI